MIKCSEETKLNYHTIHMESSENNNAFSQNEHVMHRLHYMLCMWGHDGNNKTFCAHIWNPHLNKDIVCLEKNANESNKTGTLQGLNKMSYKRIGSLGTTHCSKLSEEVKETYFSHW